LDHVGDDAGVEGDAPQRVRRGEHRVAGALPLPDHSREPGRVRESAVGPDHGRNRPRGPPPPCPPTPPTPPPPPPPHPPPTASPPRTPAPRAPGLPRPPRTRLFGPAQPPCDHPLQALPSEFARHWQARQPAQAALSGPGAESARSGPDPR